MKSILDCVGNTPLVRLGLAEDLAWPVLAKCEHLNPGGSVKDRLALAIVGDAEREGRLKPGDTLVEATAGNTGLGLAMVAAVRGYRLMCVIPRKMSQDKVRALRAVGAEVVITADAPPEHPDNFQVVARRLGEERGWFLTDQFCTPSNVNVHEQSTGPEILEQAGGRVGAFVAGAGTGGTITGVGRFLKRAVPGVQIVLADPAGSPLGGWVETGCYGPGAPYHVEGIGSSKAPSILDPTVVDRVEVVSDQESFEVARRLIREEGLFVGGSSGTAVAAALRVASTPDLRGPVVVLLPDAWDRYFSCNWLVPGCSGSDAGAAAG